MNHPSFCFACIFVSIILSAGCSDSVKVSGKVLLKSGSPVTQGVVIFENETTSGTGGIKSDGSYSIGMIDPGDGILPGTYNIAIQGSGEMGRALGTMDGQRTATMPKVMAGTSQVPRKYEQSRTSGLSITVSKGKSVTHDIVVEDQNENLKP